MSHGWIIRPRRPAPGRYSASCRFHPRRRKCTLDLDKASLDPAAQAFGKQLEGADVGVFYYAGHGVQVRDTNYLVPVEANPTRELDVDFQMLDVNLVLRQMARVRCSISLFWTPAATIRLAVEVWRSVGSRRKTRASETPQAGWRRCGRRKAP